MKSSIKNTFLACAVSSAFIASSAIAGTSTTQSNVKAVTGAKYSSHSTAGVGAYPCGNNPADVCINNNTGGTLSFSVTFQSPYVPSPPPVNGVLYPMGQPYSDVDVWSSYPFPYEYVSVSYLNYVVFNQQVPNGSIININPGIAAAGGRPTVTVTH